MGSSKKAKRRRARQRSHQQRVSKHEVARSSEPHDHLPKVGTPENDAYRLKRSREDLVGFGEFRRSRGPWPTVAAVVIGLLLALGVAAWVVTVW